MCSKRLLALSILVILSIFCVSVSGYCEDDSLKVGDIIVFGSYKNTKIEWEVLELKEKSALLITTRSLCELPYNPVGSKFLTWENCTLRKWLNHDFLDSAFTKDQISLIQVTHVDNSTRQHRGNPGTIPSQPDTDDQVFLLSWQEVCKYFPTQDSRVSQKRGWWTRSGGEVPGAALGVGSDGYMYYGNGASSNEEGIRPVIWLNISIPKTFSRKSEDSSAVPEYVDQSSDFEFRINGAQAVITKYKGKGGTVFIPPSLGGKPVKILPESLFSESIAHSFGAITCVVIPEGVTKLEDSVFYSNDLEEIYIPSSVTSIGDEVFSYCRNLRSIHVDPNNKKYKTVDGVLFTKSMETLIIYPCGNNSKEYVIPTGVKIIGGGAFSDSSLEKVTIPEGVTTIGRTSFWGCTELKSLYIPSTVSKIHDLAFGSYNYKMESYEVSSKNKTFASRDGVLFSKNFDTLIDYPKSKQDKEYVIPDTVNKVNHEAFGNCYYLEKVTLSKKITKIYDYMFYACHVLHNVVLHDKVTYIGRGAFGYANDLRIFIPSSVTTIDAEAFFECKNPTIEGKKGSYAEKYAKKNGITFVESN